MLSLVIIALGAASFYAGYASLQTAANPRLSGGYSMLFGATWIILTAAGVYCLLAALAMLQHP